MDKELEDLITKELEKDDISRSDFFERAKILGADTDDGSVTLYIPYIGTFEFCDDGDVYLYFNEFTVKIASSRTNKQMKKLLEGLC